MSGYERIELGTDESALLTDDVGHKGGCQHMIVVLCSVNGYHNRRHGAVVGDILHAEIEAAAMAFAESEPLEKRYLECGFLETILPLSDLKSVGAFNKR